MSYPTIDDEKFSEKVLFHKEFYTFKNDVLKYTKNDFEITTSWISLSNKEQKSNLHNHKNCMYSGILYLQTNENSGDIMFDDLTNF